MSGPSTPPTQDHDPEYDRNIDNIPQDIKHDLLWRAGSAAAAGILRGCGDVASSTDEAAVKDVTDPRGCGEDERWKPEEELEGVCGDMSDDEVPIITKPAEFHRKLIRGEWTSCDTNEVFPYNFGIACGNWGGIIRTIKRSRSTCFGTLSNTLVIVSAPKKWKQTFARI